MVNLYSQIFCPEKIGMNNPPHQDQKESWSAFKRPLALFKKKGKVDLSWDDEGVLPKILSLDTEFVFQRMTEETLRAVAAKPGASVLDVGCGRAIDAATLAKTGALLYGCDPSFLMLRKAREWVKGSAQVVYLVRCLAENLPFRQEVFSRVYCKGAIDHFSDPESAVAEMCRVAQRGGKIIIAVANMESLSCTLGRKVNALFKFLFKKEIPPPHIWELPPDHNFKFDYSTLKTLANNFLRAGKIKAVSLFWGFPKWGRFLKTLPRSIGLTILRVFDVIASWYPPWGDVLILVGHPQKFDLKERRELNG